MLAAVTAVVLLLTVAAQVYYNRTHGDGHGPVKVLSSVATALENGFRAFGSFCARYLNVFEWIRARIVKDVLHAVRDISRPVWRIAFSWIHAGREMAYNYFWLSTALLAEALTFYLWPEEAVPVAIFMAVACAVSHARHKVFGDDLAAMVVSGLVLLTVAYMVHAARFPGVLPYTVEFLADLCIAVLAILSRILPITTK
jgi:hypothetical protein